MMQLVEVTMRLLGSMVALAAGLIGLGGAIAALSSRRRREKHEEWLNTMAERKSLPAGVAATFVRERNRTAAKLAAALWVPISLWALPTSIAVVTLMFLSGYTATGLTFNEWFSLFNTEPSAAATADQLESVAWPLAIPPAILGWLFVSSLRDYIRALGRRDYLARFLLKAELRSLPERDKIPTDFSPNWLTASFVLAAWFFGGFFGMLSDGNGWVALFICAGLAVTAGIAYTALSD